VRDEAHRFAITYHRSRRDKAMTKSILDDIPGLGPTRRKRLLKEFGSVKKIRTMTEEELVAVPWLPEAVARRIYDRLHTAEPARSPVSNFPGPATVSWWSRDE
jgi:excinuclease ABC subunit C